MWLRRSLLSNYRLDLWCAQTRVLWLFHNSEHLVFHSLIEGDVPMARVKMNAKHEYEFIANFKVLQNVFKAKKIDKVRCNNSSLQVKSLTQTRLSLTYSPFRWRSW